MELPITLDKLQQMTTTLQKQREERLQKCVTEDVATPQYIVSRLQDDVRTSIFKRDRKTSFTYDLAKFRIYSTFGREDSDKAIQRMLDEYVHTDFPTACTGIEPIDFNSCTAFIQFSLPWLSGQTNSHPEQPK